MGSLNGTLVNSNAVHNPHSGSRQWGDPIELANGDVITLGTTSRIFVSIWALCRCHYVKVLHLKMDHPPPNKINE